MPVTAPPVLPLTSSATHGSMCVTSGQWNAPLQAVCGPAPPATTADEVQGVDHGVKCSMTSATECSLDDAQSRKMRLSASLHRDLRHADAPPLVGFGRWGFAAHGRPHQPRLPHHCRGARPPTADAVPHQRILQLVLWEALRGTSSEEEDMIPRRPWLLGIAALCVIALAGYYGLLVPPTSPIRRRSKSASWRRPSPTPSACRAP
jgi:hypothetical protein